MDKTQIELHTYIKNRIKEYLCVGGLFNPECMEHDKVRDMIIEIRNKIENYEYFYFR